LLLSPLDVLKKGFAAAGLTDVTEWTETGTKLFRSHYGSSPVVIANIWYDLMTTDTCTGLTEKDESDNGFRMHLIAHHFLWAYPKNSKLLASLFHICDRNIRGEPLWRWVRMIAALKTKKIVWDESLDDPSSQVFIVSVDGTDFKVWEKKHPLFTIDKGQYSHKYNHGALKYEIAIDVYRSKVVWISGPPHRGGKADKTIFEEALKGKIQPGKKVITDRVYGSKATPEDHAKLALPNPMDDQVLANFKSRARCRHETFNGRLKFFHALSDTYHHSSENHVHVFEAICVIVQYQMDNGGELFQT
jgi:hypothetical protein